MKWRSCTCVFQNRRQMKNLYIVTYVDRRMVSVQNLDKKLKHQFNSMQLKPYYEENRETNRSANNSNNTCMTKVFKKGDPKENLFSKRKELKRTALAIWKTWKVVSKHRAESNILGGRFLLATKNDGTQTKHGRQDLLCKLIDTSWKHYLFKILQLLDKIQSKLS